MAQKDLRTHAGFLVVEQPLSLPCTVCIGQTVTLSTETYPQDISWESEARFYTGHFM